MRDRSRKADQRALVAAISERFIPTIDTPGAIAAGVPAFIEMMLADWYETQDRNQFLDGIGRVDGHARVRFDKDFASLSDEQKHAICDDICHAKKAKNEFKDAAKFFSKFRNLTATLNFDDRLSFFTGTDLDPKRQVTKSPRINMVPHDPADPYHR